VTSQHDRTIYHTGTESTDTAVLSAPIGRYASGTTVQVVLTDMAARLTFIEANPGSVVTTLLLSAWIGGPRQLTLDAVIRPAKNLTLDAQIRGTVSRSLSLDAYFLDHAGGSTTLAAPVSSGASTITVTSTVTFPAANGYTIQIGSTQYTVTGGAGSTTWTISPTAATNYSSGTAVSEVC